MLVYFFLRNRPCIKPDDKIKSLLNQITFMDIVPHLADGGQSAHYGNTL